MGCQLLLKQQPGRARQSSTEPRELRFSSSLHTLLLLLFRGEMKQKVRRLVVSISLLYLLKSSWRQEEHEQIFARLEMGNNRCPPVKWSKRHSREQRSDRNTEGRGKKGFWDRLLWAEKRNTEAGLETDLGTPPEAEKMSSTVKTLWDPKNQRKGAVTVMEMSKMSLGIEPIARTAQEKKHPCWGPAGLSVSKALRKKTKQLGVTANIWAPCLCCHSRLCRIGSAGSEGKVWGLGFLRPMLFCLLSLVLSLLPFWQELWRMWWLRPSRAGTDKGFAPSEVHWNTLCNSLTVACYLMFMNVQDMENVAFTPSFPNTAVTTAVLFHTAIALS